MTAHFEAKKHAYRQTQDGIVVSFVVHPNDMTAELATAALGTRYMVAFSEIGDDGKPLKTESRSCLLHDANSAPAAAGVSGHNSPKDRRPFNTLPLSQQAALRCGDMVFQNYIGIYGSDAGACARETAVKVRELCGVTSRAELDTNPKAAKHWLSLDQRFSQYLTDQQYAESIHR